MKKKEPITSEKVITPRGTFKICFNTMKEANENEYYLWFTHNEYQIVGNGTYAYAVNK